MNPRLTAMPWAALKKVTLVGSLLAALAGCTGVVSGEESQPTGATPPVKSEPPAARDIGSNIPTDVPVSSCVRVDAPVISKDTKMNDMPEHSRLYLDTIAMAFACNVTRIASVMWGGGENNEAVKFNDIDISAWHSQAHGDPDGAPGQQLIRLQAYFASEFLYFVQKLKSMSEGDVSLLDNTAAVLCTQNGSSQLGTGQNFAATDHPPQHAPFVVAGSCGGAWRTGRLLDAGGRNHNDVYASIARAIGMDVTSVGRLEWCKGPLIA